MKYLLSFALSLALHAQTPTPCYQARFGSEYDLTEGLTGNSNQATYTPYLDNSIYIQPGCASVSAKYLSLYSGNNIVSFSDESGGAGFSGLAVTGSCSNQKLFSISTQNGGYLVVDAGGTCIAKVASAENLMGSITLRDCTQNQIGTAVKTLVHSPFITPQGTFPSQAIWHVSITNSNVPDQLMPYLIAMNDNVGFSCPIPTPTPPSPTGISTGAAIGMAAVVTIPISIMVGIVLRKYYRKQDLSDFKKIAADGTARPTDSP